MKSTNKKTQEREKQTRTHTLRSPSWIERINGAPVVSCYVVITEDSGSLLLAPNDKELAK